MPSCLLLEKTQPHHLMSTSTHPTVSKLTSLYDLLVSISNHLQSPFILAVRLVWGIELLQAGWGKLTNIDTPTQYFTQLGIPFPHENAYLVGCTETFGGLFMALGLLSRLTALPLIFNFIVAYATTEKDALVALTKLNPDPFAAAAPFLFLLMAVLVLAFGPGAYSLDYIIARVRNLEWRGPRL